MNDCVIIGGGVMGLSIAWELARAGRQVTLLERGALGREASWAGAGILPPPTSQSGVPPWRALQSLGYTLHRQWSERLLEETGIANGYRVCGGIHLARKTGESGGAAR